MFKFLLYPASWLYKMAVLFRHQLFDWGILHSEKFDIPVICIGNITVGGTGKTPMAEMVIAYMSQMHNVALLSRGYGRRTKGYREVKTDSHYRDVGDEPLQIKLKFPGTVVVVCEKRAEGIRRIRAEHPEVDLIIMDDGFQHRYVEPKINIVMIDATRPIQHDRMLPLGTLRDLPEELHRAHYFVVTKCPEKMAPIDRRIMRKVLIRSPTSGCISPVSRASCPSRSIPMRLLTNRFCTGGRSLRFRASAIPSRSLRRCANATRSCRR